MLSQQPLKIKPVTHPVLEVHEMWYVTPIRRLTTLTLYLRTIELTARSDSISITREATLGHILTRLPDDALGFIVQTHLYGRVSGETVQTEFHSDRLQIISPLYLLNRFGMVDDDDFLPDFTEVLNYNLVDPVAPTGFLRLTKNSDHVFALYGNELEGDFPKVVVVPV